MLIGERCCVDTRIGNGPLGFLNRSLTQYHADNPSGAATPYHGGNSPAIGNTAKNSQDIGVHQNSRQIVDPPRLLDWRQETYAAVAIVVTSVAAGRYPDRH